MKLKILHVLNSNAYSGAENVVITIINNSSDSFQHAYASISGSINDVLKENAIDYYSMDKLTRKNLGHIIEIYKPDIIHSHDFTASVICALIMQEASVIFHLHNNSSWIKRINLRNILFCLCTFRVNKILVVSKVVIKENALNFFWHKKAVIVENPIDYKKMQSLDKDVKEYDLIFLGRMSEAKNPQRFINLIEKLRVDFVNLKSIMVGNGEMFDECQSLVDEKKLNSNIELLGFRADRLDLIARSKIMVITSKWEGYGIMCVEGMANALPIVSTSVGGLSNLVNDNCGMLCISDDEFIGEISKLLKDSTYYNAKSEKALQRAKELNNIDEYIQRLENIYVEEVGADL